MISVKFYTYVVAESLIIGTQKRNEPKQVIFSDGIRPGGDLTELDGSNKASSRLPLRRATRNQRRVEKSSAGNLRDLLFWIFCSLVWNCSEVTKHIKCNRMQTPKSTQR